jgi:modulator of drug activity B
MTMDLKNVLIINAHQFYEGISSGRLNNSVIGIIKEEMEKRGCTVKLSQIEKGYDVSDEVQKHLWADLIITQSPVYWFGSPWIYKKYIDDVFTLGMLQGSFLEGDGRTRQDPARQYGSGGKMQGKKHMLSLTWNAPRAAFGNPEQLLLAGKSVDDVFVSYTASYKFCGAEVLPAFSCFDVIKSPDINADFELIKQYLSMLFD